MYVLLKSRFIIDPRDSTYSEFSRKFDELLLKFEESIVPHLVEADI